MQEPSFTAHCVHVREHHVVKINYGVHHNQIVGLACNTPELIHF